MRVLSRFSPPMVANGTAAEALGAWYHLSASEAKIIYADLNDGQRDFNLFFRKKRGFIIKS